MDSCEDIFVEDIDFSNDDFIDELEEKEVEDLYLSAALKLSLTTPSAIEDGPIIGLNIIIDTVFYELANHINCF